MNASSHSNLTQGTLRLRFIGVRLKAIYFTLGLRIKVWQRLSGSGSGSGSGSSSGSGSGSTAYDESGPYR